MAQYRSAYTGQQIDTAIDTVYNLAEVATSGDYDDLINKPSIPSNVVTSVNSKTGDVTLTASDVGAMPSSTVIPTKVSDLTNDSGFITTETDPTVPEWAKQSTKPTYTASEVGALPDTYVPPEEVMVVTFTKVDETSYTADKTFEEVLAAKYAVARALNNSSTYWWYVPTSASSGAMAFSRQQGGKHSSFTWMKSSGNITYSSQDLERQSLKVTEITSSSTNNQYPSAKATYDFVNNAVAGISCISDSQVNGTSIVSNGVANLVTETAYNSSTNKIATMSDVGTMTIRTWSGAAS